MNDKNNNRIKDKIAPALLSSLGLSLTVFVFGAFELYANNMAEFAFGLWDFFGIFIAIALGLTIVLSLALIWLPKRIFDVVCALLSALALMLYVQGTFLTLGMNSIEGDGVGEGAISAAKIAINAVIWVVVIAAGVTLSLIFSKKNSSAVRTAIIFLMVVVLGMQTVSFVTVAATTEGVFDKDNKSIETVDVLTYNELESVGSEKNVIYFVRKVGT